MKKILVFLFFFVLLSVSLSFADEEIDLSAIKDKDGFYYSDETTSEWTYYVYASGTGLKGEKVEIVLASWGRDGVLNYQPEIRFFVTDEGGEYLTPRKAIVAIGSNIFEIDLRELSMDDLNGSYVKLVGNDDSILKSLATGNDFQVLLQCGDSSVQANFSGADLIAVRDYAIDMLKYDFVKKADIVDEAGLFDDIDFSSITAYIFEEIDLDTILGSTGSTYDETWEDWKKYTATAIGVTMFFPPDYDVYTREMSDDNPAAVKLGLTGIEIAEILADNNLYIEAIDLDNNEILVTMKTSAYSDFSGMSDETLRSIASLYPFITGDSGILVSSTDIYRINDLAFILYEGSFNDGEGNYTNFLQYNTTVNGQTISFVWSSKKTVINDVVREHMASIMERVIITKMKGKQKEQTIGLNGNIEAKDVNPDDFDYDLLDDGSIIIKKYIGDSSDVIIPSTLNGYPVNSIEEGFSSNNSIRSISIADGVKNLGSYVFSDCSNLKEAWIPDSVITMGSSVFSRCEGLEMVKLPANLTEIPATLFYGCTCLSYVDLPEKIAVIRNGAFERCYNLSSINIPNGVTSIEQNVFRYCTSLSIVIIPDGVETIGNYAFIHCTGLTSVSIPESVQSIGKEAFGDCSNLIVSLCSTNTFFLKNGASIP